MKAHEAKVGVRVRSNRDFAGIPKGAEGVIDALVAGGRVVMVAWDLPDRPLPKDWRVEPGAHPIQAAPGVPGRDGFDRETELGYLDVVDPVPWRF